MARISGLVIVVALAFTCFQCAPARAQAPPVPSERSPGSEKLEPPVSYLLTSAADQADERRIQDALAKRISFDWKGVALQDVVSQLADECDITIVLTKKIDDAGVTPDQPITRKIVNTSLQSTLRLLLSDLNLTFLIKDNALKITDIGSNCPIDHMLIRIYPVKDLVKTIAAKDGKSTWDFDPLISLIREMEPDSWQDVGGPGVVKPFDNGGCLFISQRPDIHEQIEKLLITIRRVKTAQGLKGAEHPAVLNRYLTPLPKTR